MASISPAVWIGVGLLVIVAGVFIQGLRAFIVVGVFFVAIGVFRTISGGRSGKNLVNEHTYHRVHPRNEQTVIKESSSGLTGRTCFVCGAKNNAKANFCGHCGHRLA